MNNGRALIEKIKCGLKRSKYYRSNITPNEYTYVVLGRYGNEVLVLCSDLSTKNSCFFYRTENTLNRLIPSKKFLIIDPFDKSLKAECNFDFTNVVYEFDIFRVGMNIGSLMGIGKGRFIMLDSINKGFREDCKAKVFITPNMETEYNYCSRLIKATDNYEPYDMKLESKNANEVAYDLFDRWDKLNHVGRIIALRYIMRCKLNGIKLKPRYSYDVNGNVKAL